MRGMAPSESDSLKAGYLAVIDLLESPANPGQRVPLFRFTRFWHPDYQLNPEQIPGDFGMAGAYFRREPDRSRRVVRVLTANWLAYLDLPAANRPKPDPKVASFDLYSLGPKAPARQRPSHLKRPTVGLIPRATHKPSFSTSMPVESRPLRERTMSIFSSSSVPNFTIEITVAILRRPMHWSVPT